MRISDWSSDVCSSDLDDLIAVPDGTTHWFDMGPEPSFVAIRFFTEPDGWVGHFTGTDIAQKFPRYENKYHCSNRPCRSRFSRSYKKVGRASSRERVCQYG